MKMLQNIIELKFWKINLACVTKGLFIFYFLIFFIIRINFIFFIQLSDKRVLMCIKEVFICGKRVSPMINELFSVKSNTFLPYNIFSELSNYYFKKTLMAVL